MNAIIARLTTVGITDVILCNLHFCLLVTKEECLREETKYHTLTSLIGITRIKIARANDEKNWQSGEGSLMRDFASLKDLYAVSDRHVFQCSGNYVYSCLSN